MPWGAAIAAVGAIGGAAINSSASKSAANQQSAAAGAAAQRSDGQYYTTRNDQAPYRTAGNLALAQLQKGLGLSGAPGSGPDNSRGNFNEQAYLAANPDAQQWVIAQQQQGLGGTAYDHYIADGARRNDPSYFYNNDTNAAKGTGSPGTSSSGVGYGSLLKNFSMADFQADPGTQFVQDQGEKSINRGALAAGRYNSGATLKSLDAFNTGLANQTYGNAFNRYTTQQTNEFNKLSGLAGTGQQATTSTDQLGYLATNQANNYLTSGAAANAAGTIGQSNALVNGINTGLNYWSGQQTINALKPQTTSNPYIGGNTPGGGGFY